ncbi:MACPF domain-containing protein [Hordeum vulgare]|nr:MACPF domain-containing protein [Hordeum vulgare]
MRFRSDVLSFQQCPSNSTGSYLCLERYHLACSIACLNLLAPGRKMLRVPRHLLSTVGVSHYILLHSRRHKLYYEIMLSRLFHQPGSLLLWQGLFKIWDTYSCWCKMGGKDVIYLKQQHSSSLQAVDVQKRLKEMSDRRFLDANGQSDISFRDTYGKEDKTDRREQRLRFVESSPLNSYASKEDLVMMPKRRGGKDRDMISHSEWLTSVQAEPDVISMSFIPITSLLNGVPGSGFLNHAINLYLRYKPPVEELHQFLEFQLPRQWAPVYSDLPLGPQRKKQSSASLPVNFIGPTLYVCTNMVDVGKDQSRDSGCFLKERRATN